MLHDKNYKLIKPFTPALLFINCAEKDFLFLTLYRTIKSLPSLSSARNKPS
jgi:hypothetical protein